MTPAMPERRTNVRWSIVALLFFATTVNYIDRAVFGILGPMLGDVFKWSEVEYSRIEPLILKEHRP
jgi:ACS family hexuronate transporter-like MFS transporter